LKGRLKQSKSLNCDLSFGKGKAFLIKKINSILKLNVVNEMDVLVYISLAIFAIVLIVGIVAQLLLRKTQEKEKAEKIDYQAFFILGISFFPLGFIFTVLAVTSDFSIAIGIPFLAMGIIYLAIGLSNRNKWKRNKNHQTINS
jgi:L-asparagine transporter-like permease